MNKKFFLTLACLFIGLSAWGATPTQGKYYRFANQRNSSVMSENFNTLSVVCVTKDVAKYQQIWEYTSSGALQNVYTGHFLQKQNSTSKQFTTGTSTQTVGMSSSGAFLLMQCGGYLHCDASNNVVNWWDTSAAGNLWTFEEVAITEAEVQAARAEYQHKQELIGNAETYTALLKNFFDDDACTQLKSNYKSMKDSQLRAALATAGLPTEIQNVVVKVKNQWNDETTPELSAKFRVRDYKIYSRAEDWRWVLNASQLNDMNNPTGVYGQDGDFIFVFVGSDIPEGTTLGIAPGANPADRVQYWDATSLKKGLNIICCDKNNAHYWMMYTPTNKQAKPLADYPDLKIHVEGGDVIGYVNVEGMDETTANAEYKRVLVNANTVIANKSLDETKLVFAVLGQYGLFNFPIETFNKIWATTPYNSGYNVNYQIYKSINFYDDLLMREWGIMGLMTRVANGEAENTLENVKGGDSYIPTYVNNHAPTLIAEPNSYPYSTTGYTNMPGTGAVESSYNGERADFDVWCAAHESGHNNQGSINMESCTEVSNNFYSNIITSLYGYRHSRGNTFADTQNDFSNNVSWGQRSIDIEMRMYYNLWLYYHKAGHRKDFSPRLFQLLRSDPMQMNSGEWISGPNGSLKHHHATVTWIKFYKHVCEAAQEDLTEYFRLWGFFVPLDKKFFGDYTNYYVSLTQQEIDEAIAEVKAKKYPENLQIMFIEDRILAEERTDPWAASAASDKKYKPLNNGTFVTQDELQNAYGNIGHYSEFIAGQASKGNYLFSGFTSIKMTGEGGVGFLVFDSEDSIVYRSNKLSFTLPEQAIKSGYTIKCINGDGTLSICKDAAEYGTTAQKREALMEAISAANDILAYSDPTGKKVGYYPSETLTDLQDAVDEGDVALKDYLSSRYYSCTMRIKDEMLELLTNGSKLQVKKSGIYSIQNYRSSLYLSTTAEGTLLQTTKTSSNETAQWAFIPQSNGEYVLQNVGNRMMIRTNLTDAQKFSNWSVNNTTENGATGITLKSNNDGTFYLKTTNNCINCDPYGNIASWSEDKGSQWYITTVKELVDYSIEDIQNLIEETTKQVNTICTIEGQTLQDAKIVFKPGFENTDPQLIINAMTQVAQANEAIAGYTTMLSKYDTYTALYNAYKALPDFNVIITDNNNLNSVRKLQKNESFTLSDNIKSINIIAAVEDVNLTYTRSFDSKMMGNWQAWYMPCNFDYDDLSADFDVAQIAGVLLDGSGESYIAFKKMTEGTVKAHTPYVIRSKAEGTISVSATTTLLPTEESKSFYLLSAFNEFTFGGVYANAYLSAEYPTYAMNKTGNFAMMGETVYLRPLRIYMRITDREDNPYADEAPQEVKVVVLDEDETSVDEIHNSQFIIHNSESSEIYNLAGQKLQKLQKGVNIVNGKKILF